MDKRLSFLLSTLFLLLAGCASQSQVLLRDTPTLPKIVQETFSKEGKGDYILVNDEGYSFRLIYLCENRVYNFVEEPEKNHVLVSLQPILDTSVEQKLGSAERARIWACMELRTGEELRRVEERVRKITLEREQAEKALAQARNASRLLAAELEQKRLLKAERQRRLEEEARRAEEERLRKAEEEQRRKAEEERKVRFYRGGAKDDQTQPAPVRVTEIGVFILTKEANVLQEPRENSKVQSRAKPVHIFDVLNSRKDQNGFFWYQVVLNGTPAVERGKKTGWSPEERSFWIKNKLLVWVYPGELSRIQGAKPIRLGLDDVQFTGRKITIQQKSWYEIIFEESEAPSPLLGWIDGRTGIRRNDKTKDEAKELLREVSRTGWAAATQNDILAGVIRQGFTPEQVSLAWGRPNHVNTTRTLVGSHEQWVYGEAPFPNAYVYFENGLVKSWEFLKKPK